MMLRIAQMRTASFRSAFHRQNRFCSASTSDTIGPTDHENSAEETARRVERLVTSRSGTLLSRTKRAERECHKLLVAADKAGMSMHPGPAAHLYLCISILRGKDGALDALLKHALASSDALSAQDLVHLLRGSMLWSSAPRNIGRQLGAVQLNTRELSDDAMFQLSGCLISMKVNPVQWIESMEEYVMENVQRLSESSNGLSLLSKVVFAICNNSTASEEMLESVKYALDNLKPQLECSPPWVHLLWCCALEDVYPVRSLESLFRMDHDKLRALASNKMVVKYLNDLHWLFFDGVLEASLVGGFGQDGYVIVATKLDEYHRPRRFMADWRSRFKGAHCCLFDVRTREKYTLDIAALRSSTSFEFIHWNDDKLHPAEVTAMKMDKRRYCSAQAILILDPGCFVTQSHFPLGWVRMQKKVLGHSGWDVSVISKLNLVRSGEDGPTIALKTRLDEIHRNKVLHCHGRISSAFVPRDTEHDFLEPKIHRPGKAKVKFLRYQAVKDRKRREKESVTSGPRVRDV